MDLKEKIGARIVQLRKEKKLTQQKFAYAADMERTFLTHIEKGRKNISVGTLERLLNALEVSLREFFDDDIFSNNKKKKA